MTTALQNFANGQLAAGSAAIMMTPMVSAGQITGVTLSNGTAAINAVTIYLVRSGGAPGPANIVINAKSLAPGMDYTPEALKRVVAVGDALWGFATNGAQVNFTIDGYVTS